MNLEISTRTYAPDDTVLSCRKLESGLRFGQEGIAACAQGPFQSPIYWTADEAASTKITREMIAEKRKRIFDLLNDNHSCTPCKGCQMVFTKKYRDVNFSRLGHIDFSATSLCNIRCNYCSYTKTNSFAKAKFDSLAILKEFSTDQVEWDAAVDFGGGEPTLLPNFNDCLDYFVSRRIRVFLYTNAAKYSQAVYDGLVKGAISWVCTSLDAGTPSTYRKTKERDYFTRVMENLFKYADASQKGIGNLSVKYIFTQDNCGDDDISGFTYAMLALKPDKVWLTFDFEPLKGLSPDSDDFGAFDYSRLIDAYVKTYLLMKQYGLIAGHFTENHLSQVNRQGQILLERVRQGIDKGESAQSPNAADAVDNKPSGIISLPENTVYFKTNPLQIKHPGQEFKDWSLKNKRILLVPASALAVELAQKAEINTGNIIGFIDRDPILQGKTINNLTVYGYNDITNLQPDVILIAAHRQHHAGIVEMIDRHTENLMPKVILE